MIFFSSLLLSVISIKVVLLILQVLPMWKTKVTEKMQSMLVFEACDLMLKQAANFDYEGNALILTKASIIVWNYIFRSCGFNFRGSFRSDCQNNTVIPNLNSMISGPPIELKYSFYFMQSMLKNIYLKKTIDPHPPEIESCPLTMLIKGAGLKDQDYTDCQTVEVRKPKILVHYIMWNSCINLHTHTRSKEMLLI